MRLRAWLRIQRVIFWRNLRFALFVLRPPRQAPGTRGVDSFRRRAHTAAAYAIAWVVAAALPVIVATIVAQLVFALGGARFNDARLVLYFTVGLYIFGMIAGRFLYRYAAARDEATVVHDWMKAIIGLGGPVGQYLRPLPASPFVYDGVSVVLPSAPGWHTSTSRVLARGWVVQFAWWPASREERRAWARSRANIGVSVTVAPPVHAIDSAEGALTAASEGISSRLADTDRMRVDPKDIDLELEEGNEGWTVSARYSCRTVDSHTDRCVDVTAMSRVFPHSDGRRVVVISGAHRVPCDQGDAHLADIEAFVRSARLLSAPTAAVSPQERV
jgi:hypothetical protein